MYVTFKRLLFWIFSRTLSLKYLIQQTIFLQEYFPKIRKLDTKDDIGITIYLHINKMCLY